MSAQPVENTLRDLRMVRWDLEAAAQSARGLGAENTAACLDRMRTTITEMMKGLEKCGTH